jgi:hypothetical protein
MFEKNDVISSLVESGHEALNYLIERLMDYGFDGINLPKDVMKIRTGFFPGKYESVENIAVHTYIDPRYEDIEIDELVVKLSNDPNYRPISYYTHYQHIDWVTLIQCVEYAIEQKENN